MDLERLKQNLRLRSGRTKKARKAQSVPQNPNSHAIVSSDARKETPNPRSPGLPTTIPAIGTWDTDTALPQLPTSDSVQIHEKGQNVPPNLTVYKSFPSPQKRPSRVGRLSFDWARKDLVGENQSTVPEPISQGAKVDIPTGPDQYTDSSDLQDFDLRPPPPRQKPPSVESLSESLFSPGHLNLLLRSPVYLARFTSFIIKYNPRFHPLVLRYLESQKAIAAVEYANAVAETLDPWSPNGENPDTTSRPSAAATLNKSFEESSTAAFRTLLDSALPMYVTYNLVRTVSEYLVNEIAGRQTPVTQNLVGGLSEVFCLTDPNQPDNPIIYASEEFYRYTGYGRDDVIGHNCRFLQGTKTKRDAVTRIREGIVKGEQASEAILNYRRDGRPFINLLMIAPLHDDKGNVKYHIGAQVDVTSLVERGKGLDGFERFLVTQEIKKREAELQGEDNKRLPSKPPALEKLRELSQMFDLEESAIVRSNSGRLSQPKDSTEKTMDDRRRFFGGSESPSELAHDDNEEDQDRTWELGLSGRSGLSGRLPGVYDSYLLIRPAPSLRVVFASPKMRQRFGNSTQHPFMSHVAAPSSTLAGLKESFGRGIPASAKITYMLNRGERRDGTRMNTGSKSEISGPSRSCWISATPLVGSDDKIGVWMVVVVEKNKVTAQRLRDDRTETSPARNEGFQASRTNPPTRIDIPAVPTFSPSRFSESRGPTDSDAHISAFLASTRLLDESFESLDSNGSTLKVAEDEIYPVHVAEDSQADQEAPQSPIEVPHDEEQQDHEIGEVVVQTQDEVGQSPEVENKVTSEEQFIMLKSSRRGSVKSERVQIHEDSDGEPEALSTRDLDEALTKSLPGSRAGFHKPIFDDPPLSPDHMNTFHGFSDNEDTPRRANTSSHSVEGSPSPSRPATSGVDSPVNKANGKHYMDYLRHPGSARPSSEYNRPLSGSGLLTSRYHADEENPDGDNQGPDGSDLECARTPYSVD
ncbi:hypothetical protein B0A52_02314 [Exophiala mesophila]|uniref:PAC domain-containing protein n=1 Tax=Exophiala mesophila TaxID=212818 RepID=A0A438NC45_EXOME|nr:hypothetical protein B0A52_02314 [Exophiala mesophila]